MTGKIKFSWDIHWDCNYRCPYCWWHGRWGDLKERNIYPGTQKLIEVWKRIYNIYGEVEIDIAGGEPFTYPDFIGFLKGVLEYHRVSVMTNLSFDADELLQGISDKKLARLKTGATLHPAFSDPEEFLSKALKFKQKDLAIGVMYLSYPPQIPDIPFFRKMFDEKGIYFSVSTFWGEYEGKNYPQSYTEEELETINPSLGKRSGKKFQTEPFRTRGKLCSAGHTYGIIHPDGEVLPCGGGAWKGENIIIGNIFDEDFRLRSSPRPCPSEQCPCNEWAFLMDKKEIPSER